MNSARNSFHFARRVYEMMRSWEAANPGITFKIEPTLSRIFALVPEYDSGRLRKGALARGAAKAPTIFTANRALVAHPYPIL